MAMTMLSEQLRRAIDASGLSHYAICKRTAIDKAVISKFMSGKVGLSMDSIDRIGELLKLSIVAGAKPTRKAR